MLLINGNIITMEGDNFSNGYVYIQDGKIISIGDMLSLDINDENTIDLNHNMVLPGFIDAHCHVGIWEDGLGFEGDDGNEETDPITPQLRAIDAVNPLDNCFSEALKAGITTILTGPGSANPIAGQFIAMKTYGKRIDDMVIRNVGIKLSLGENPKSVYNDKNLTPMTRMAITALIREQLEKTKRYIDDVDKSVNNIDIDPPPYDIKCEALMPLLKGEVKAFFHAHRADDIFTAIRISKEYNLDTVIVHATEGYKIKDELAKDGVCAIVGPVICDRSKPELKNLTPKNAGELQASGVQIALCTDHPVVPIQYLTLSAAVAVKSGLNHIEALKAITINAAKIAGIDSLVGSIKVGKDADLIVFDDDPLSTYSIPKMVLASGKIINIDNG